MPVDFLQKMRSLCFANAPTTCYYCARIRSQSQSTVIGSTSLDRILLLHWPRFTPSVTVPLPSPPLLLSSKEHLLDWIAVHALFKAYYLRHSLSGYMLFLLRILLRVWSKLTSVLLLQNT